MADTETIRKRLEKHILRTNHTFREVSLNIGRKDSYIQQYVKYGFPKRLNEVDRKRVCQFLNIDEKELIDDELINQGVREPVITDHKNCIGDSKDYIMVDIYAPRPNVNFFDSVVGRMALNYKEFASWCGANPQNLRIIRIEGDYMEPVIARGSLVLYDTSSTAYKGDGIYVVHSDNLTQVKRVQKTYVDTYLLINDNPRYQNVACLNLDVEILGRALCCLSPHHL